MQKRARRPLAPFFYFNICKHSIKVPDFFYFCPDNHHRMPRRFFAILFASFASIIILAHDAIPHHHNGDKICFEFMQHDHSCNLHGDNHCSGHHQGQPGQKSEECCLLNQLVLLYPFGTRQAIDLAQQPVQNKIPSIINITLLSLYTAPGVSGKNLPYRQHPPCPTYLSESVGNNLGLRAPPVA